MNSRADKQRLFVALWPSPEFAEEVAASSVRAVGDGRPIGAEKLHLTLQFLGDVPATGLADVGAALDRVSSPSFELFLERFGYWQRTRVVWLGPSHRCEALHELASGVVAELRSVGFKTERRPFRAHITVARNCRRPGDLDPLRSLRWPVRQLSLVASTLTAPGALYRQLQAHALS